MYRSLNCYRSAISSVHLPVDGFQVGQHPLVTRLLKGVFNSRPPMPRYKDTWEVSKVLRYLPNESLSLKDLTKKLAMLLALSLANRSSDLVRLSLEGRRYTPDRVNISPVGLAKQSNPQRTSGRLPVFIPIFQEDQLLCPVACLQVYKKRTAQLRKPGQACSCFCQYWLLTTLYHHPQLQGGLSKHYRLVGWMFQHSQLIPPWEQQPQLQHWLGFPRRRS